MIFAESKRFSPAGAERSVRNARAPKSFFKVFFIASFLSFFRFTVYIINEKGLKNNPLFAILYIESKQKYMKNQHCDETASEQTYF